MLLQFRVKTLLTLHCLSPFHTTMCITELKSVIQRSFKPTPNTVEIDEVYDVKKWMKPHTPNLHDHLKAHQFKFEKNQQGYSKMFYKEWSIDPYWLPHTGISLLISYESSYAPAGKPLVIQPIFDPDVLEKLAHTTKKIRGYLQSSGVAEWWSEWMADARQYTQERSPKSPGMSSIFHDNYYISNVAFNFRSYYPRSIAKKSCCRNAYT